MNLPQGIHCIVLMTAKTYPLWLNIICAICLALPIIGFIVVIFSDFFSIGMFIMGIGFLGIAVFGEIATRIGKPKKKED